MREVSSESINVSEDPDTVDWVAKGVITPV